MKIDFTLTLDQFIELQNLDRHPRNSMSPLFVVCAVVLLIVVGYSVAFPSWEDANASGPVIVAYGRTIPLGEGLIIEIGLLLPFAAIGIWIAQGRRNPKNSRRLLQNIFGRFYAGPRTFEAQESTWQFGFRESLDTRNWADLARIAKTTDCFILQDAFSSYALPQAAVTAEQCSLLEDLCRRALVPKESLFSIYNMVPTARNYVTAMMLHDWWQRPWQMAAFVVGGLACVSVFTYAAVRAWPTAGYLAVIPLVLSLPLLHAMRKYERFTNYRQRCFQTAEITDDRICFITGTLQDVKEIRIVRYRWLWKVRESGGMIFLYVHANLMFLIPKAGFESKELSRFRELLNSHLRT